MRKSRLKILPARCLAQLGFLLLYLACPILGEMSRSQPDHGLASSLTLHVLEHCASPPKDPGDGSCSPVPEDVKLMTRNENGHPTCSVATHLLNLATKCAPEDEPFSKQSSKVTTVTLVPRRLLAARSKSSASIQKPIKSLPKRRFQHRSLKRESNASLRDSSLIAEKNLVRTERDASRRSTNVARRSVEERRNVRTEVTRTISRFGSENLRSTASERLNSRNLNRDAFRSAHSRDTDRSAQGESRRLRRASYWRVAASDIRNKPEYFERSADKGRRSPSLAERRSRESRVDDKKSRIMDTRRISLTVLPERRMDSRTANFESRRFSVERTLAQTELNERRSSPSRVHVLDSSRDGNYRKVLAERRLSGLRTTEIETKRFSRRLALQGSRTAMRVELSQKRLAEVRLQNDEPRKLHDRKSSEARIKQSRTMYFEGRQMTSPDRLSFRSLVTDRESRRKSVERLSLQRSTTDRRLSESEGRLSLEQRRRFLRSVSESREDTGRRISESRRSSASIRVRYDSSRRLLGIARERQTLETSQQTLLRRVSDKRTASRSWNGKVVSKPIRENSIISGAERLRRSISLERSDSNRAYRVERRLPTNNGIRNLPAEMRMSENSRQQRLSARRAMETRDRAAFRELSLSEMRERVRTSRGRRTESPDSFNRRVRALEERSASRRTFSLERQEVKKSRDQNHAIEGFSKDVALMERRAVSDRFVGGRRFTLRTHARSGDPLLTSRRQRVIRDRSALEPFNFRSRSVERENRRAVPYGPSRREMLEERNLGRISREDSLDFLRFRRADSARNIGRRISTIRTADMRDSTRSVNERNVLRLNMRASHVFADRRNTRRISAFRSANARDTRVTLVDFTRLQGTSRRLEQTYQNARAVRVRLMERESNHRLVPVSAERENRRNVWVTGKGSQRDGRLNRQLKATSAEHFLKRNVRSVSSDAIRRQSANRHNALILKDLRTTQGNTYETYRNSRYSELRKDRRYILSADRKNILRDNRQSTDRLMSAVQYERRTMDNIRITRNSKSRNYVLTREKIEYSNYARFNRKAVSSQELFRKSQRYEFSAFRKMAVYDNRLIASKTDNYRAPEITAKNVTAKTDMVREAKVAPFNKYSSSWLKDLTTTCSMKWHTEALWQQIFLILATLSWTKIGCIDTITDKVSSYLFASENLDIIGATKTAASNDRDNILGTVIGGGAAAAALLLFSTRTK